MGQSILKITILLGFAGAMAGCGESDTGTAMTEQARRGEYLFQENCAACHALRAVSDQTIPSMKDIIGREVGVGGYPYSAAMRSADFIWTEEKLDQFLENPRKVLPGNQMAFYGMPDPDDRKDLISYLLLFSRNAER